MIWRLAADVVLVLHLAFVIFVVLGGILTWRWPRLALVHVPVAVYGMVIQLVGFRCPLTPFEKALRRRAGDEGYDEGFVEHYIVPVLYPGEFTAGVKLLMALLVLGINVAVYMVAWRVMWPRRRAERSARTSVTA